MQPPPRPIRTRRRQANTLGVIVVFLGFVGCVGAGLLLGFVYINNSADQLGPAAADLTLIEKSAYVLYLSTRYDELNTPTGTDTAPLLFSVAQGDTVAEVCRRLVESGLVRDAELVRYYMRYRGFDSQLEAGDFVLRQTLTPIEVATLLTDASARQVATRIGEGWRLEQIGATLSSNVNLKFDQAEFMRLATTAYPTTFNYAFLREIPAGKSLEGFLLPDTYLLHPGADAKTVLDRALGAFEKQLPAVYRTRIAQHNLNLYQAVIIASLIEREAVLDEERPIIASVILNRLAIGQALEIDATVQYAIATPENWWPPVLGLDFRAIANPYNTYYVTALPAGPIANPRLSSLLAVADPAETNYYYYRAQCERNGRHNFAVTYEEHLANACP